MAERDSSASLLLLRQILESSRGGRVFTSDEAVARGAQVGLSPAHSYKLLSELADRHILERPRHGLYVMQPPFGGLAPVRPIAIAVHAVQPAAVSGESALSHWGLLEQALAHEETVSTPTRIQWKTGIRVEGKDRLWQVAGVTIRFRVVFAREMFGITTVRLDAETVVPMFDRERAVLDLLLHPTQGSADWAAELLQIHRKDLRVARLRGYARRVGLAQHLERVLAPGRVAGKVASS